ncbi:MAG: glycosyltransferase [Myxococcaceae bacterium]
MRVAIVHDWLVTLRGGERVLEALLELFPHAEVFTLFHQPGACGQNIDAHPIRTSWLNALPGARARHRMFLPLFPSAIERFDFSGFDLVVSSSHCVAKGVRVPMGVPHVSYVHAPMRYMWDLFDDYFGPGRASLPIRAGATLMRPFLQRWDRETASRPTHLIANSHHIAEKIEKAWGRKANVVHPPVNVDRYSGHSLEGLGQGGYFLWVGALAPYKRLDIVLDAVRATPFPLWVVGGGQDEARLRRHAPPHVRWLGVVSDEALGPLYRNARALVFPGEEDFGITPLEALACGRPVIALAKGGALETLTPEVAVFFDEPTPEALLSALHRFEQFQKTFSPNAARARALQFGKARFLEEMRRQFREAEVEFPAASAKC